MVNDDELWAILDAQTHYRRSPAPVGVLPVHPVALVQTADSPESLRWSDQAGPGDPVHGLATVRRTG